MHNHPSGDPRPSDADIHITRQMRQAGELLQISLLDHVILGAPQQNSAGRNYFSFKDGGLL